MSPEREVTSEQVDRLVEKLGEVVIRLDAFMAKVESDYLRKELYVLAHEQLVAQVKANNDRHDEEIREIEKRQTLIARTAVSALLFPIFVIIVAGILSKGTL
jgi:uncharacterized protein YgbK (DUF1537 family)